MLQAVAGSVIGVGDVVLLSLDALKITSARSTPKCSADAVSTLLLPAMLAHVFTGVLHIFHGGGNDALPQLGMDHGG